MKPRLTAQERERLRRLISQKRREQVTVADIARWAKGQPLYYRTVRK